MRTQERQTLYNLYYSTALYENGLPYKTANLAERDMTDWKQNYWKEIKNVDFFLDIDAPSHEEIMIARDDTLKIIKDFDDNMKYELRFTGCGFHIVIPQQEMMYHYLVRAENCEPFTLNNIWHEYTNIANIFSEKYTELIDTQLNDSRRIIKMPYSLAFYEDGTFVCSPLTKDKLKSFELQKYSFENYDIRNIS